MKSIFLTLVSLLFATTARAQWKTTTYTLKGGWNAIYLTGDATHGTLDSLLPGTVLEVWRWQPNPTQVGFTESPLIPSSGTAEWSVWKRGLPAESSLTQLIGQMAYLVKCSGTSSNTYSVALKQSPQLPTNSWVRNGANLLGFPTYKNGSTYPTMASYLATFPAAIAANAKVYKYVGGELGATNPLQVFSPSSERLDATQAYWFSAEVTGDFYAPLEISPSSNGLAFGRDGSLIKVLVRNRSAAAVTLTLTPVDSESAPSGMTGIVGKVPLTKRSFNATSKAWTETPITASYTEAIGPKSTVELIFGINRTDAKMTAASSDALFASLLRITDSSNLMEVYVPATAQASSLAGLWVGDVSLTNVSNRVSNGAQATATLTDGVITGLTVVGSGGFGYTSPPVVTIAAPHANSNVTATATATIDADGLLTAVTPVTGGSGYLTPPSVTFSDSGGSPAAAEATVSAAGIVTQINLIARGNNYLRAPFLILDPPPASVAATATAVVSSDKTIASITSDTRGSFHTTTPAVTIAPPIASIAATATAVLANGALTNVVPNNEGRNYLSAPTVTIDAPPASAQATATAVLSNSKTISGINQTSGGGYYLTAPTVTIESPPASVTATATATVAGGILSGITVDAAGTNYSTAPIVSIAAPAASVTDAATAKVSGGGVTGIVVNRQIGYYETAPVVTVAAPYPTLPATAHVAGFPGSYEVFSSQWGSYYKAVPTVTLTGGSGSGASAVALLSLTDESFKITSGDKVYSVAPNVTITGGGGSDAWGYAILTNGKVTGVTIALGGIAGGSGFTSAPTLTFSGGRVISGTVGPTAVGNSNHFAVRYYRTTSQGSGYENFEQPTVTVSAPPAARTATATATVVNGQITAITVNDAGTGYSEAPVISIASPTQVTATATSTLSRDGVASFTITNAGMGYATAPTVTISAPPAAVTATATAVINNGVVTDYTLTNAGSYYTTPPTVTISGGSFSTPIQAVATSTLSGSGVANYSLSNAGAGYTTAPAVTVSAPPSAVQATATAILTKGLVTGFTLTNAGTLYDSPPVVTVEPPSAVQATATCVLDGGSGVGSVFTITNAGSGYPSPPAVNIYGDYAGAEAIATLTNGSVTGYKVTKARSGYSTAPDVIISSPPANAQATATATVANGAVTDFTVNSGGGGYEKAPAVTIDLPPPQTGSSTPTPFKLRTLLHLSDGGTARLLSEVYLGQLAATPNEIGLCTSEALLKPDALASAQCFSSSHLPMDQVITSGSGSFATGQTLTRVINVPYNDATNPFVHAYHPDHDNKDARGQVLGAGVEAPNITRACKFIFTASPPAGSSVTSGWGSSVIGGNYIETMTGVHKDPLILSGTFELRRASQIGTLSQ